jgi:hypothetical protein
MTLIMMILFYAALIVGSAVIILAPPATPGVRELKAMIARQQEATHAYEPDGKLAKLEDWRKKRTCEWERTNSGWHRACADKP